MHTFIQGIIGCGRLGAQIARDMLTFAEVTPSELLISTRRPMLLGLSHFVTIF